MPLTSHSLHLDLSRPGRLRPALGAVVIAASLLIATSIARAHGAAEPRHGGIVQTAAHLTFELLATADGARIFVTDHDKDYDATALKGRLTVLNGTAKAEADLVPAGGNTLEARGIALDKGARVVAVLTLADGKSRTLRFVLK